MRVLLKVSMATEAGNKAIAEGKLPGLMMDFIERTKPEGAYFLAEHGKRTAMFFFDLASTTDIPTFAEPFFATLGAHIELTPAMNVDEMRAGVKKAMEKRGG